MTQMNLILADDDPQRDLKDYGDPDDAPEFEDCRACRRHRAAHTQCGNDDCGAGICWSCGIVCEKCQRPFCRRCAAHFHEGRCEKCQEEGCEQIEEEPL